jgi:hypothetical protein
MSREDRERALMAGRRETIQQARAKVDELRCCCAMRACGSVRRYGSSTKQNKMRWSPRGWLSCHQRRALSMTGSPTGEHT